ncbi:MAG TPA: LCP family protein, partial [Armatimonadota bacterium]|nr:LCP family protein [Armatimonadota bacterium]
VTVDKQMDYDDNWGDLHIHLRPGKQLLDGREALGFVRFRKSNDGNSDSDHERIARQQQFLMALRDKTMSSSTFLKLPDIIETVRGGVNSSMSDAQMMALVRFIRSLPAESIRTATLPGTEGRVYVTADEDAARELIDEMFLERPGDRSRNRDRT